MSLFGLAIKTATKLGCLRSCRIVVDCGACTVWGTNDQLPRISRGRFISHSRLQASRSTDRRLTVWRGKSLLLIAIQWTFSWLATWKLRIERLVAIWISHWRIIVIRRGISTWCLGSQMFFGDRRHVRRAIVLC